MSLEGAIACFLDNATLGFEDCKLWNVNLSLASAIAFSLLPPSQIAIKRVLACHLAEEVKQKIAKTKFL
ncbi:MAG: hypothetical protein WCD18_13935 [Thermosynechococcaceae cyanobacterium]